MGLDVAKGPSTRRLLGLCWKAIMTPRSTPKSSLHHDRRCCHTMGLVIMPFVIQILHVLVGLDVAKGPSTRRLLGLCWKAIMTPRSTPKSSLHHDRRCCHTMGLVIMPFVIQILHVLVVVLIRSPRWRTSTMPRPRQERTMLFDERRMH